MAAMQTTKANQPKKKSPAEILRERKILAFQEQIAHDAQTITELEERRSALARTDVVGLSVVHKTFGIGTIVAQRPPSITVKFDFGDKRFIMPSAFVDGFLTSEDSEINDKFAQYQDLGEKIRLVKEGMNAATRSIRRVMVTVNNPLEKGLTRKAIQNKIPSPKPAKAKTAQAQRSK